LATPKVFLMVSIDTECDKGPNWIIQKPLQFSSILRGIPDLLTPLFLENNVKPTYLLSPEVIKDSDSRDVLRNLKNCELGTHLHGEFIEPQEVLDPDRTKTPQFEYSKEVEREKLINLTSLFEKGFGRLPTSFRSGRWGIGSNTIPILEELGYRVDSSVAPFTTQIFETGKVRFWGAPFQPYHPSLTDFCKRGRSRLLEVPATSINPHFLKYPRFLTRYVDEKNKIQRKIFKRIDMSFRTVWLRPFKSSPDEILSMIEALVETLKNRKFIFLNMMFHSNEVMVGASPYVLNHKDQRDYFNDLRSILSFINEKYDVESLGLSEATDI
jgi:hypothetical protein